LRARNNSCGLRLIIVILSEAKDLASISAAEEVMGGEAIIVILSEAKDLASISAAEEVMGGEANHCHPERSEGPCLDLGRRRSHGG
jgi:hypothetical protein